MKVPGDFKIEEFFQGLGKALGDIELQTWGAAVIYIIAGFIVGGFLSSMTARILSKYTSKHYIILIRRLVYYSTITIFILVAVSTLQLNMKVVGIATILTLALGFASQTAVSNVISGLFLVFERPFLVGDIVEFENVIGEILSIDLLSIKVLTFDNSLVRLPNEILLKSQFKTLTKFPIRRLDTWIRVDIDTDLNKMNMVLFDIASKNPLILEAPDQQLIFESFAETAIVFRFAVWVKKEMYYTLKNSFPFEIHQAFREHRIKIPRLGLYSEASVSNPSTV